MRKILKNEKGFTLIELLAVIVILGILMIVAIPMVTRYIEQARRDTFVDTAKTYISAARYAYSNDDYSMLESADLGSATSCSQSTTATIPIDKLDVDNAGKSPFGGNLTGEVKVEACKGKDATGGDIYKYKYYVSIKDATKGWGIKEVLEKNLNRNSVKRGSEGTDFTPVSKVTCSDPLPTCTDSASE